MNKVIEAIKERRSVRSYKPDPISRDVIVAIIDAGNWAPTGNNYQRWRFVVVEDNTYRQKLIAAALPTWKRVIGGFGARVTDDEEIVEALELKDNERIYGPIVIGYPEIYPEAPPKKPPVVKWI